MFQSTWTQQEKSLPKGLSESEYELISKFQFKNASTVATATPEGSVRTATEWEAVEYLVVRWNSYYENILR